MAYNQPYYGNMYNPYNYNYQTPQYIPQQQPGISQPTAQQPMLYGKVVDNYNTADSQDVPIGMSGIYPKADGTAIFVKKWLDNGTTRTNEYKLVEQALTETEMIPNINFEEKFEGIYGLIDELGKKIDKLSPIPKKKKIIEEVDEDDE